MASQVRCEGEKIIDRSAMPFFVSAGKSLKASHPERRALRELRLQCSITLAQPTKMVIGQSLIYQTELTICLWNPGWAQLTRRNGLSRKIWT